MFCIIVLLPSPIAVVKGGDVMDIAISMVISVISVMASIVAYYICKWLDR